MTLEDRKWRNLCQEAMRQNDVNKLFEIFLELDRATARKQREQRRRLLAKPSDSKRKSDLDENPEIK